MGSVSHPRAHSKHRAEQKECLNFLRAASVLSTSPTLLPRSFQADLVGMDISALTPLPVLRLVIRFPSASL